MCIFWQPQIPATKFVFLCKPSCWRWNGTSNSSIHLLQFVSSPSGAEFQHQRGARAEVEYWLDPSKIFASLEPLTPPARPARLSEGAAHWIHLPGWLLDCPYRLVISPQWLLQWLLGWSLLSSILQKRTFLFYATTDGAFSPKISHVLSTCNMH